jgi:ABC-type arginine transport system permease subunit
MLLFILLGSLVLVAWESRSIISTSLLACSTSPWRAASKALANRYLERCRAMSLTRRLFLCLAFMPQAWGHPWM